jgi:L-fuconolactonase
MITIDTHHHFWRYDPVEYDWITDDMYQIKNDFLPEQLKGVIEKAGVDAVVTVQARQTVGETEWLFDLAAENDFIRGVVGWLPLINPDIELYLERYSENPYLKALRHVLQGEKDEYMLTKEFNHGIGLLKKFNLVYDILIFEKQLPAAIQLVDHHPDQLFVLDHIAKPRIAENILSPWKENICKLAERPNVYCKISGMVTEADFNSWTREKLYPYLDIVMETFGPDRLMFGSDWPVCLTACEYEEWLNLVKNWLGQLSVEEQAKILGKNAVKVYRL